MEREQSLRPERTRDTEVSRKKELVPKAGLEPARLAPHAPQTCVSAISPLRHLAGACPRNCVLASLKPSTHSAVRLGLSLAAALLQGLLKLLQLRVLKQTVALSYVTTSASQTTRSARGRGIIEVGQNPCQSIGAPVESGGSCRPDPPTLRKVITTSRLRSTISLNGRHKDPSLRCSMSTTRSCLARPARYDSSGFCGGVAWWDGAS